MAIDIRGMAPLLLVSDMNRSLEFYRDGLDFVVVSASGPEYEPGWALLQRGTAELMLNGMFEPGAAREVPEAERTAAHGDTSLYFGCADLEGAYDHFRSLGVDLGPPTMTGYGFRSIALRDPDGYSLVFHWPETSEARAEWERRYGAQVLARAPERGAA